MRGDNYEFLVVLLVLICISFSAIAEPLTKEDIQSLEANMTKLQETVTDMDKRLTRLEVIVTEMDKRLSNQITDVSFYAWKSISNDIPEGYGDLPPDLVVGVISPNDSLIETEKKALAYLEKGSKMVWVISPKEQTVTIYRKQKNIKKYGYIGW